MPDGEKVDVTQNQDGQVTAVDVSDPESGASGGVAKDDAAAEVAVTGGNKEGEQTEPIVKDEDPVEGTEDADPAKVVGGPDTVLVCPKCGHEMKKPLGKPARETKCPECGEQMAAKTDAGEDDAEEEDLSKAMIPKPVKAAVLAGLREGSERLMSLLAVLRAAKTTEDQVKAPLPNKVFSEIKAIQTLLASLVQRYPAPASKEEDGVEKAATAHQSLLSEKFAAIAQIGAEIAKAGEGMDPSDLKAKLSQLTDIAWSVREIAIVTAVVKRDEKIDGGSGADAIQELLKQAAGLTIPKPVRDAVIEKIRAQVEKILSVMKQFRDMKETDEETKTPMPGKLAGAIKGVANDLGAIIQKYPSPATKHDSILFNLQKHLEGIKEIVSQVLSSESFTEGEEEKKVEEEGGEASGEVAKSGTEEEDEKTRFAKLEKRMDDITKLLTGKKSDDDSAVQDSNATDADGSPEKVKKSVHSWPQDLAAHVKEQEEAEKAAGSK